MVGGKRCLKGGCVPKETGPGGQEERNCSRDVPCRNLSTRRGGIRAGRVSEKHRFVMRFGGKNGRNPRARWVRSPVEH